jgi:hypothetical protein
MHSANGQSGSHRVAAKFAAIFALALYSYTATASDSQEAAAQLRSDSGALRLAQAGSTGGTLGKQDKSISGDEEPAEGQRPRPDKSERPTGRESNTLTALPSVIRLNEHAIVNYSITLTKTGDNTYHGTWSHGYVSTFTVTSFTKDSLNMLRQDNPAIGSVTGTYTGQRSGNSAHGSAAISNGFISSWDATWP